MQILHFAEAERCKRFDERQTRGCLTSDTIVWEVHRSTEPGKGSYFDTLYNFDWMLRAFWIQICRRDVVMSKELCKLVGIDVINAFTL